MRLVRFGIDVVGALVGAEWRGCCVIVGYPGVRVVGLVEGDVVRDAAYKTVSKSLSVGVSQNPFGVTRPNGSFYEESSMICVPVAVILAAIGLVLEIIRLLLG